MKPVLTRPDRTVMILPGEAERASEAELSEHGARNGGDDTHYMPNISLPSL